MNDDYIANLEDEVALLKLQVELFTTENAELKQACKRLQKLLAETPVISPNIRRRETPTREYTPAELEKLREEFGDHG